MVHFLLFVLKSKIFLHRPPLAAASTHHNSLLHGSLLHHACPCTGQSFLLTEGATGVKNGNGIHLFYVYFALIYNPHWFRYFNS